MGYRICVMEGDGIGHEVIPAALEALCATGVAFDMLPAHAGWEHFQQHGEALPAATLEAIRGADAALMGVMFAPARPIAGYRSPIVALRQQLDLWATLRPARSWPLSRSRQGVDILIVRESSECLYARPESRQGDTATVERVITRQASQRIGRLALKLAAGRRRRLTIVHKANIFPLTCGLFRDAVREVAADFPDVQVDEVYADTMALRLLREPEAFDVIVTTNLFGDLFSGEVASLCGGLGLAPSANQGEKIAVFAPVHGSAPDIAGRGIANPMAAILAGAMLLRRLGEAAAADALHASVEAVIRAGITTPDLGGRATTAEVTAAVIRTLTAPALRRPPTPLAPLPSRAGLPPAECGPADELAAMLDEGVLFEPLPACPALDE